MKKIAAEWLKAAKDDLDVIEKIVSCDHLTHIVAFHAQQCMEKSFKAVIEEFEIGAFRIHHLQKLYEHVKDHISIEIQDVLIEKLDKLYTDSRYPGELGLLPDGRPDKEEAQRFYQAAKETYDFVKNKLELRDSHSGV